MNNREQEMAIGLMVSILTLVASSAIELVSMIPAYAAECVGTLNGVMCNPYPYPSLR